MKQILEISDLSTRTGDRMIQLIRETQLLLHGIDFPHDPHENSLSERGDELETYIGKIVALRSIAPAGRIERNVEHWSGALRHERYTPNAVGTLSLIKLLGGGIELRAEERGRFTKRDVEYNVADVVDPKTFEPLFVAEVFEPR